MLFWDFAQRAFPLATLRAGSRIPTSSTITPTTAMISTTVRPLGWCRGTGGVVVMEGSVWSGADAGTPGRFGDRASPDTKGTP